MQGLPFSRPAKWKEEIQPTLKIISLAIAQHHASHDRQKKKKKKRKSDRQKAKKKIPPRDRPKKL